MWMMKKANTGIETRLRYDPDSGKFTLQDRESVRRDVHWDQPYIVINRDQSLNPHRQRVVDGAVQEVHQTTSRYYKEIPAKTVPGNKFYCEEIDDT